MSFELYPHQEKAVEDLSNGKILRGNVGSGKSLAALAYYVKNESPKRLIIITTAKKRDKLEWESEAGKFVIGKEADATMHGVMTVDSWNNIAKYFEVRDAFFIFDEQRLVGSGKWVKSFLTISRKNNWILLSGTPGDTWMDYVPIFLANGFYKNRAEFLREHVIFKRFVSYPAIDRYIETEKLELLVKKILVEMPYANPKEHVYEDIEVPYDEVAFRKVWIKRWHIYEDRPLRNVAEMFRVARMLVNSHPSRIDVIRGLMEKHPKLIVFYNFDYELRMLRELAAERPTTEWNGHKHQEIPETEEWLYLVQYQAGAEGWNCTETDAIAFYSLSYSYKQLVQARGRIDRLSSKFVTLFYYQLSSSSLVDLVILRAIRGKRSFSESKYAFAA